MNILCVLHNSCQIYYGGIKNRLIKGVSPAKNQSDYLVYLIFKYVKDYFMRLSEIPKKNLNRGLIKEFYQKLGKRTTKGVENVEPKKTNFQICRVC